jgi:hypothetical protein
MAVNDFERNAGIKENCLYGHIVYPKGFGEVLMPHLAAAGLDAFLPTGKTYSGSDGNREYFISSPHVVVAATQAEVGRIRQLRRLSADAIKPTQ